MAKNKQKIPFTQVLQALLDAANPFPARYIYLLSDVNPKDAVKLREAWPKLLLARRRALMEDLLTFGEEDDVLDFSEIGELALTDKDPQVRRNAVRLLGAYEDEGLIPPFLQMLAQDPDTETRAVCASALGVFVFLYEIEEIDPETGERIMAALLAAHQNDAEKLVRRRALESLGFMRKDEVAALIVKAYETDDEEWLVTALFAMGRSYNSERYEGMVLDKLQDVRPEVRSAAVAAAGEIESEAARSTILTLLKDHDDDVRAAAIWSLSQIGGDDVYDALVDVLEQTEDEDEQLLLEEALENLEMTEEMAEFELMALGLDDDDNEELYLGDFAEDEDEEDDAPPARRRNGKK